MMWENFSLSSTADVRMHKSYHFAKLPIVNTRRNLLL
jgi:hypothetical protein